MNHKGLTLSSSLLTFALIAGFSINAQAMPKFDINKVATAPDYSKESSWLKKPAKKASAVDVFYVYPTVLFNDTDWMMDPKNAEMRKAAQNALETQASIFNGQANIYAPMYRQMNLAGLFLTPKEAEPLQKIIHEDVWRAFTHYLKYENKGRPFFLAGHSQGSMILTDLMLKHWGKTGAEKKLIAAHLLGWSITPDNLKENPALSICDSAEKTGCIISYNTMAKGRQSKAPTLQPHAIAVNPLSWSTNGDMLTKEKNLGSVFFDKDNKPTTYPLFTSAQIVEGGLVVKPANMDLVTVKGSHFPKGIFHAFDYSLFFKNLKENVKTRISSFQNK